MSDEFERIARTARRIGRRHEGILVGVGDDAAVLASTSASTILTVDAAVEGVHFRRELLSWEDIGYRAFSVATSDVAAMGGRGRASLLALVLPSTVDDASLDGLVDGVAVAAGEAGAPVVGGNLSSGTELSITVTVLGEVEGEPLRRNGAQYGDGIYVTGTVGSGALGLALLEAGHGDSTDPDAGRFIRSWRRPTPQLVIGQRLRGHATAAIDISDGLAQDLHHLCQASAMGAEVQLELLPQAPGFERLATELDAEPTTLMLASGDDYQLLFTAPADATLKQLATRIGRMTPPEEGVRFLDAGGEPLDLSARGFRHFE